MLLVKEENIAKQKTVKVIVQKRKDQCHEETPTKAAKQECRGTELDSRIGIKEQ